MDTKNLQRPVQGAHNVRTFLDCYRQDEYDSFSYRAMGEKTRTSYTNNISENLETKNDDNCYLGREGEGSKELQSLISKK